MSDCIFCKIVSGEVPSKKVYEDENVFAFNDTNPTAPIHVLIVPKKHIEKLSEVKTTDKALLGEVQIIAVNIAKKLGIKKAFRLITFNGEGAGQTVFHLHYHLQGGWKGEAPTPHNIK